MKLEDEFEKVLWGTVRAAREHGYNPTYFLQMLEQHGGIEAARRLLSNQEIQPGLIKLCELNLLADSVEAIVLQPRFHQLFTAAEREEAKRRLTELGYSATVV